MGTYESTYNKENSCCTGWAGDHCQPALHSSSCHIGAGMVTVLVALDLKQVSNPEKKIEGSQETKVWAPRVGRRA